MKKKYYYRKQWRCVGQEYGIFFRDTRSTADRDNFYNNPEEIFAVEYRDAKGDPRNIADCWSAADAKTVRDALNAKGRA